MSFDTSKYLQKYLDETEERLGSAETALLNMAKEPDKKSLYRIVKREVHTLKGSSKMLGFEGMNKLAHAMEDFLEPLSDSGSEMSEEQLDTFLSLFDVLREGAKWVVANGSDSDFDFSNGNELLKLLLDMPEDESDENGSERDGSFFDIGAPLQSMSKKDLFLQLGLGDISSAAPEVSSEGSEALPEVPKKEEEKEVEPPKGINIQLEETPEAPKDLKEEPQKNSMPSKVNRIVDDKRQERVFQHQVKVDVNVIDNLTHHAMEASFHLMHFENILLRYKGLGSRFRNLTEMKRDTVEVIEETNLLHHGYSELFHDFQGAYDQFNNLLSQLTDSVLAAKLIPLSNIFNAFPRYVRDLSRELGKKTELIIEGQETKLDKNILSCLNEALIHIIRNAIDHGIETPEERKAHQKPEQAKLELKAFNKGNKVVILVRDDGQGINLEKVKQKALEKKLVMPGKVEQLTRKELLEFIFLSGFSTSELTTDISGRGVGMDVVRKNINRYHGQIEVETEEHAMTEFRIVLPMAMSTSQLLFVQIEGKIFGLPLELLSSVQPLENSQIMLHKRRLSLISGDKILEVVDIGQYLGLRDELNPMGKSYLLKTTLYDNVLLLVDRVRGQKDQVVKKFDDFLGKPMFSSGATQTEEGKTIIVLDVFDLVNYRGRESQLSSTSGKELSRKNRILLIDDSAMTREIEASILESAGYEVTTGVDGLDGFEKLSMDAEFDLIVTDIEMPRMDGFQFVEKVRKTKHLSSIPVIMVTSLSKSSDRLRGLEVGANAYLSKQALAKGALLQTVRQFIKGD